MNYDKKLPLGGNIYEWVHGNNAGGSEGFVDKQGRRQFMQETPQSPGPDSPQQTEAQIRARGLQSRKDAQDLVDGKAKGGVVDPNAPQPPGPTDTVPVAATPGEFVIPAPVVAYLGQKFFNELLEKAKAEMGGGSDNPYTQMANEDDVMPQGFSEGGLIRDVPSVKMLRGFN
jgi:hypothetical protein